MTPRLTILAWFGALALLAVVLVALPRIWLAARFVGRRVRLYGRFVLVVVRGWRGR